MATVILPSDELTSFDLPAICMVTGQTEGVTFKPVRFAWYPRWVAALILCNLLIMLIVALILTKRVKGELPFTEEGYRRWQRGRLLFGLSVFAGLGLFFAGMALAINESGLLALLAFIATVAVPVGTYIGFARGNMVVVKKIDETTITLEVPSQEAAERIERHLVAGRAQPAMATAGLPRG